IFDIHVPMAEILATKGYVEALGGMMGLGILGGPMIMRGHPPGMMFDDFEDDEDFFDGEMMEEDDEGPDIFIPDD
ncbi:MAG: hypothetical protein QGD94_11625, partial [Planctomycetia bacterium]|nr:hypothetical protein [Planctomycetia bacterium]